LIVVAGAAVVAAIAGVVLVLFATRSGDDFEETPTGPLYERILAGMTRTGMVLHTMYTVRECERTEAWIDVATDTVAEHFYYLCAPREGPHRRTLRRDGTTRTVDEHGMTHLGGRFVPCRGADAEALIFFMSCVDDEEVRVAVTHGEEYEGRAAMLLRAKGEFYGIDSRVEFDDRLYVDETSGLPIARVRDIRDFYVLADDPAEERVITVYTHEFVERASLPVGLFEPEAYGAAGGE
jgi:hypothetical protein